MAKTLSGQLEKEEKMSAIPPATKYINDCHGCPPPGEDILIQYVISMSEAKKNLKSF